MDYTRTIETVKRLLERIQQETPDDPFVLRKCLDRLSHERLTPARARTMLATRGIRTTQKALEQTLRLQGAVAPDQLPAGQTA